MSAADAIRARFENYEMGDQRGVGAVREDIGDDAILESIRRSAAPSSLSPESQVQWWFLKFWDDRVAIVWMAEIPSRLSALHHSFSAAEWFGFAESERREHFSRAQHRVAEPWHSQTEVPRSYILVSL